jgi:hypothetical protein
MVQLPKQQAVDRDSRFHKNQQIDTSDGADLRAHNQLELPQSIF